MPRDPEQAKWLAAYQTQKSNAKRRGIEWHFTFKSWMDWWGDDIQRRGVGSSDLCMQRVADTGPYADWNVRKGHPIQNIKTRIKMHHARKSERIRKEIYAAELSAPTVEWAEPDEESEFADLGYKTNCSTW